MSKKETTNNHLPPSRMKKENAEDVIAAALKYYTQLGEPTTGSSYRHSSIRPISG